MLNLIECLRKRSPVLLRWKRVAMLALVAAAASQSLPVSAQSVEYIQPDVRWQSSCAVGAGDNLFTTTSAALAQSLTCNSPMVCWEASNALTYVSPWGYWVPGVTYQSCSPPYRANPTANPAVQSITAVPSCVDHTGYLYQAPGFSDPGGVYPLGRCLINVSFTERSRKPCNLCVANPIVVGTGNKRETQVDYEVDGSDLRLVRTYNSSQQFGSTWAHNFTVFIQMGIGPKATLITSDRAVTFEWSGSQWVPDADVNLRLTGSNGNFYLYNESRGEIWRFDGDNKLYQIQLSSGVPKLTLNYAGSPSRLSTVVDAFGKTLTFSYDSQGRVSSVLNPAGGVITYSYDSSGNLAQVIYPDSTSRQYVYNEQTLTASTQLPNHLTGIVDENSSRYANYGYNAQGTAVLTEHAGGADRVSISYTTPPVWATNFSIDVSAHIKYITYSVTPPTGVTVTQPSGQVLTYTFAGVNGGVVATGSSAQCLGLCSNVPASRSLDSNGNPTSVTDHNGVTTTYTYDTSRNLETSRTEAYGTSLARTITTTWDSVFRLPVSIVSGARTTSVTYGSGGLVATRTVTDTSVTPNVSRTWSYTYNSYGKLLTENGPRTDVSDITTFTYYSCSTGYQCGQINTVTNAAGQVTTYNSYNAHGQPTQITDPNGVVMTMSYDLRQRPTARCLGGTLPSCTGGELAAIEYWPTGLLKKVTLPDGSYATYAYDAAHRLVQVSDGLGNHIDYTLDAMGNHTAENAYDSTSALKRTHSRVFNTLNQLYQDVNASSTGGAVTSYTYDTNGNLTGVNAPLSRSTTSVYDEFNRLKQAIDPATGNSYFAYDTNDNLTSVTDARGNATTYAYNGFGDVKTQTSPDTGVTTNTFDSGGNLATSTDARGAVASYTYDVLNRVTSAAYTKSGVTDQTLAYTYDAGTNGKGHLTGVSDANHAMSWTYDGLGRATAKNQTVGTLTLSLGYSYTNGQLTSIALPSGNSVSYGYDANGRVSSISVASIPVLSGVTYDPFGPVTGWTWDNSVTHSRSYDQDGRVAGINTSVAGGVSQSYAYDGASRITGITDSATNPQSWSYGYDVMDRLTSATGPSLTQGWTYDANGNRLSETGTHASTFTVSSGSNRVTSSSGYVALSFSYDAVGNTVGYDNVTLSYNNRNRLASTQKGSSTRSYVYNALGQMVKASGGTGGTVHYAYDEAGHLIGEYDQSGNLIEELIWLGDTPVATLRPNAGSSGVGVFYVHADHLNTPTKLTRPTDNAIVWRWDHDPFGNGSPDEDPDANGLFVSFALRYPGQIFDGQAGLHQNHFRDYNPVTGGYAQSDPIGLQGGANTYSYVFSSPTHFSDPSGLDVYRGPNKNYYSDIPPSSRCERAQMRGEFITGWGPCDTPYVPPSPRRVAESSDYCPTETSDTPDSYSLGDLATDILITLLAPEYRMYELAGIGLKLARTARGATNLERQAADLVQRNAGRNRVTLRSQKEQLEIDLAGKAHNGVPTPHTRVSQRNPQAPEQPAYNTSEGKSTLRPSTQEDIRAARRFLER
jgi:RHS repeat-associated protein